jgi:tRNA pseudouridine13 synthase
MKIKQRPEDFRVEEVTLLRAGRTGEFSLYRLEKRGVGTLEALRVVARAWRLDRRQLSAAGLKDRHAWTGQVISVRRGPQRNFQGRNLKLNYLGRCDRPAARGTIARNDFRILLRHLKREELDRVAARARAAARCGLPNYYDDQRFGSLRGTDGEFVARALLDGDHERALQLALARPARQDRREVRLRRRALRDRWGRWGELVEALEPSLERRVCGALERGADFAQAYRLLDPALRSLHRAAYVSHLFNACVRRRVPEGGPQHPGVAGPYVFFRGAPGPLEGWTVPLVSAKAPPDPTLERVLGEEGLDRARLERLPFRGGERPALARPGNLEVAEPDEDELNPGRWKLPLSFALRPGSYATLLVKRCCYDL